MHEDVTIPTLLSMIQMEVLARTAFTKPRIVNQPLEPSIPSHPLKMQVRDLADAECVRERV